MASTIYLGYIDGAIHLSPSGPRTRYSGSGEPWESAATTPFTIAANDAIPPWTPQAPVPATIYGGGPPFRTGSDLLFRGYPVVTETLGVQMYATSHNNAVALLRLLRRYLSTTLTTDPPTITVQPSGATSPVTWAILSATVQETPDFINKESDANVVRAAVTWTRAPLGGRWDSGETLASAVTAKNTGTGSPNNLVSLGTSGTGDLINEGGPVNVALTTSTPWTEQSNKILLATVTNRTYTANTSSCVTSSTTGALVATLTGVSTNLETAAGLRGRVLVRCTSPSSNLQLQARVSVGTGAAFWLTPWARVTTGAPSAAVVDLGAVPNLLYGPNLTSSLSIAIYARSSDGTSTSGSLASVEWLDAYAVCETPSLTTNGETIYVESFQEVSGRPCLPIPARLRTSGGEIKALRGRAPVYIPGASLYVLWRGSGNAHYSADTTAVTVTHAPLYHTLRGNG